MSKEKNEWHNLKANLSIGTIFWNPAQCRTPFCLCEEHMDPNSPTFPTWGGCYTPGRPQVRAEPSPAAGAGRHGNPLLIIQELPAEGLGGHGVAPWCWRGCWGCSFLLYVKGHHTTTVTWWGEGTACIFSGKDLHVCEGLILLLLTSSLGEGLVSWSRT